MPDWTTFLAEPPAQKGDRPMGELEARDILGAAIESGVPELVAHRLKYSLFYGRDGQRLAGR